MAKTDRKADHGDDKLYALRHSTAHVEDGRVSVYQHNGFVDLCKGPHVEKTGKIGPFKLLSIAGAYWRGNERNPQLQRIYGTVWPDQKQLDDYLKRLQEIERRDHRVLGRELELFRIDEELGSGLVLWLPNLSIVREELEAWWRKIHHERGYTLVYTPHIAHEKIYIRSGHLEKYGDNMYGPLLLDEGTQKFWIKPMNCPGHIKVFQSKVHSYRELPMRIGELGTVYRYERGGTLHGMLRVRGFTQDDSHIFCSWDQAQAEIGGVFDLAMEFLRVFGYSDPKIYLSTRPVKRLGTDELWDKAEKALADALGVREVPYDIDEGGGVFYAPKIDIKVMDAIGREWQGPTIQIDLNLPERFDVTFVNAQGQRERAVMIHRVLFGSLERFVGGLIEHYAGNFPLWLNWEQATVIPIRGQGTRWRDARADDERPHTAGRARRAPADDARRRAHHQALGRRRRLRVVPVGKESAALEGRRFRARVDRPLRRARRQALRDRVRRARDRSGELSRLAAESEERRGRDRHRREGAVEQGPRSRGPEPPRAPPGRRRGRASHLAARAGVQRPRDQLVQGVRFRGRGDREGRGHDGSRLFRRRRRDGVHRRPTASGVRSAPRHARGEARPPGAAAHGARGGALRGAEGPGNLPLPVGAAGEDGRGHRGLHPIGAEPRDPRRAPSVAHAPRQ